MIDNKAIKIFECFKICNCDMDGPSCYGLSDGRIIEGDNLTEDEKKQVSWGSTTCSKCGQAAYIKDGGY